MFTDPLEAFQTIYSQSKFLTLHYVQESCSHGFHLSRFNRKVHSFNDCEVNIWRVETAFDGLKKIMYALLLTFVIRPILVLIKNAHDAIKHALENSIRLVTLDSFHVVCQLDNTLGFLLLQRCCWREQGALESD